MKHRVQMVAVLTGVLTLGSASYAQPIAITNHSFEANFAANNSFPVLIPTGWTLYDPVGIIDQSVDAVGVLNPTGGTYFPAGAPHGTNVALIFLSGDVGAGVVGLSQTTGATLQAHSRYTLRVHVGNIASGVGAPPFNQFFDLDGFPGYQVQLLAGGQVVAQDDNTMFAMIPEGEFRESVVTLDVGATHPRLGLALAVRVINLNIPGTPSAPAIEVDFDNVRLSREALPLACNAADIAAIGGTGEAPGGPDGQLTVDDLIVFVNLFSDATGCPGASPCSRADITGVGGGAEPPDGQLTVDDLIEFVNAFSAGC